MIIPPRPTIKVVAYKKTRLIHLYRLSGADSVSDLRELSPNEVDGLIQFLTEAKEFLALPQPEYKEWVVNA